MGVVICVNYEYAVMHEIPVPLILIVIIIY